VDLLAEIAQWASVAPERAAHVSGERTLTFRELVARAHALSARLRKELGDERRPIAIRGHKEGEMLVGFLGAAKAGRAYVPIDDSIPEQRAMRIIELSGAEAVLTPARIREWSADHGDVPGCGKAPSPDDPLYILFTSGSTGEPKGVVITHGNLATFLEWMRNEHSFAPGRETFLNQAPFSFDLSVMDLYLSLTTGGTLFSISKDEIAQLKKLFEALARSEITTWVSTPSFAQMCLIERRFDHTMLRSLRRFLFCGETLPRETVSQLFARFPGVEVWNTYGPTETTVATTSIRLDPEVVARYPSLPIGRPMPAAQVFVADEAGARVPAGERGEIVIMGPNVSPGYLIPGPATRNSFFVKNGERGYRTGDWGRETEGLLFCEGRVDGQIKLFGYRIELGDLEANIRALRGIADAAVLPVQKGDRLDSLAAFVLAQKESPHESDFERSARLKRELGERVPAYMVPRKFHFLETFPMTPNGKVDRKRLAAMIGTA
jgi:D-alanine--poly(phosphoribitol) ligase subunit 1